MKGWPAALGDSEVLEHAKTWPAAAARFWGEQGPPALQGVDKRGARGWMQALGSLVMREETFKNVFWKDAAGLGALIEVLGTVSPSDHPSLQFLGDAAAALEDWRLHDAVRILAQEHDTHTPSTHTPATPRWPSTAELTNALVYHDGVVDAPVSLPLVLASSAVRPVTHAGVAPDLSCTRYVFKGCVAEHATMGKLLEPERLPRNASIYASIRHYHHVTSIAQPFGGHYYHFLVESLTRVTPFLPQLRDAVTAKSLRLHVSASNHSLHGATGFFLALLGVRTEAIITGNVTAARLSVSEPVACGSASSIQLFLLRRELWRRLPLPLAVRDRWGDSWGPGASGRVTAREREAGERVTGDSGDRGKGRRCLIVLLRRQEAVPRGLSNFEDLRAMVTEEASGYGCELAVHAGNEPVREQLRLFQRASVAVGAHGAGLSNIIAMPPGGLVVEIMPTAPTVNLCYMDMALKLKLRYSVVLHLAADMDSVFAADVPRVRKALHLFPPEGAVRRKETERAWAGGLSRADARVGLAQSVLVQEERREEDERRRQEKQRRRDQAEKEIADGWADLEKRKAAREERQRREEAERQGMMQSLQRKLDKLEHVMKRDKGRR